MVAGGSFSRSPLLPAAFLKGLPFFRHPKMAARAGVPIVYLCGRYKLDSDVGNPANTLGGGIHRWYQSERQAFKLFNKYAGFWWRAGPRVGCASKNKHLINFRLSSSPV